MPVSANVSYEQVPPTPHRGGELLEASSLPPALPPNSPTAWDKADGPPCPAVKAREGEGGMNRGSSITIRETASQRAFAARLSELQPRAL